MSPHFWRSTDIWMHAENKVSVSKFCWIGVWSFRWLMSSCKCCLAERPSTWCFHCPAPALLPGLCSIPVLLCCPCGLQCCDSGDSCPATCPPHPTEICCAQVSSSTAGQTLQWWCWNAYLSLKALIQPLHFSLSEEPREACIPTCQHLDRLKTARCKSMWLTCCWALLPIIQHSFKLQSLIPCVLFKNCRSCIKTVPFPLRFHLQRKLVLISFCKISGSPLNCTQVVFTL